MEFDLVILGDSERNYAASDEEEAVRQYSRKGMFLCSNGLLLWRHVTIFNSTMTVLNIIISL